MSQTSPKPWPLSVSRSTGTENSSLLHALLAASTFDEISNIDDYATVQAYAASAGRANDSGMTTVGIVFWVYPTGLHGPYHETDDGQIEQHGVLLTVEAGAPVAEVVETARARLTSAIVHAHISGHED